MAESREILRRRVIVFLVLFLSFVAIYGSVAIYLISPKPAQSFMGFGILSQNGSLAGYLAGSNPTITPNETFSWHFEVTNKLGTVQLLRIVYRIENLTLAGPNETSPATIPAAGASDRFVAEGDTSINFTWTLLHVSRTNRLTSIVLSINGQKASPAVGAVSGRDFRFVFELWTFDSGSNSFQYGWQGPSSRIGAWLQIWFSV